MHFNLTTSAIYFRLKTLSLGADREEAFRSIRIFIDENIRLLKNTSKDNFMTDASKNSALDYIRLEFLRQ
jgi:hypothetical protein